ncbi:CBF-domain-containing protein [Cylindrobasidium torrendii FP15055 ss-10]|uniref:CBF-domain-containing protein n=1 Tax=Cylindrobasidium torrendii FP15055 ss-10 TaxID=1314674 RepID=A0A0D7BCE7_9AGAR|nr:CBF-domain-containing protein [Cylindrobasidium torrendii FP15055 ss-10]
MAKKGSKQAVVTATEEEDPSLVQDVSSFLAQLQNGDVKKDGPKDKKHASKPKPAKKDAGKKDTSKPKAAKDTPSKDKNDALKPKTIKGSKNKESQPSDVKQEVDWKEKRQQKAKQEKPIASSSKPAIELPKKIVPSTSGPTKFTLDPLPQWHTAPLPAIPAHTLPSQSDLTQLTARAANLLAADTTTFQNSSSEAAFMTKMISSGTLSDRLSALTLLVQSGPVHNTKALEVLKGMAERGKGKGGREESLKAVRAIVDWWVGGGAPDRKLKYFRDRPLTHPSVTSEHLLFWYFEDYLKKFFFSLLQTIETLTLDSLPYVRLQSLSLLFKLLRDKPEQEHNLLKLLVNKLGDNDKAICSKASYYLLQLLQTHPAMKGVIVTEVIAFVLRPVNAGATSALNVGVQTPAHVEKRRIKFGDDESAPKASHSKAASEKPQWNAHGRYYAMITFNQVVLTAEDRPVALKLVDLYFEVFRELLGEGPGAPVDGEKKDPRGIAKDAKGRVMDGKRKKEAPRAKPGKKEEGTKGAAGFIELDDAHTKLVSAILTGVNRALPFAKLQLGDERVVKQIDTLFRITHTETFNVSLQALVLLQQIACADAEGAVDAAAAKGGVVKSIGDRFFRTLYESMLDSRLAASNKHAMYLNLVFKSIKADENTERVKAMVRRFVQLLVSGNGGPTEFTVGGLYLLGELFSTTPGLRKMMTDPAREGEPYDPKKRDPQYANASATPLWELTVLLYHYHPTVALLASQLLAAQPLSVSADLSLNTLSHFLDRFVYKNPKQISTKDDGTSTGRGVSAMQPTASSSSGVRSLRAGVEAPVNEKAFLGQREEDVRPDEVFFWKFFKGKESKRKGGKKGEAEEDESDVDAEEEEEDAEDAQETDGAEEMDLTGDEAEAGEDADSEDDEEEKEIWKAMKASMPKAGDDSEPDDEDSDADDDEDDLPSDFDQYNELLAGDDLQEVSDGSDSDDDDAASSDVDEVAGAAGDDDDEVEDADDADMSDDGFAEGSEDEDLISMDGLMDYEGDDDDDASGEAEEWGGIGGDSGGKRKRGAEESGGKKKKQKLPLYASYEDYAALIEGGPEDNV